MRLLFRRKGGKGFTWFRKQTFSFCYTGFIMLAKVLSGATVGLESIPVVVEVDIYAKSLPSFTIVGTQCLNLNFLHTYNLPLVIAQ